MSFNEVSVLVPGLFQLCAMFLQPELYALLGPRGFDGRKDQPCVQGTVCEGRLLSKGEGNGCHICSADTFFIFITLV